MFAEASAGVFGKSEAGRKFFGEQRRVRPQAICDININRFEHKCRYRIVLTMHVQHNSVAASITRPLGGELHMERDLKSIERGCR